MQEKSCTYGELSGSGLYNERSFFGRSMARLADRVASLMSSWQRIRREMRGVLREPIA
jgi:hypothetical protein